MASDSVDKTNPLFIPGKCFNGCEATLIIAIGEEMKEVTRLYVCKEYLAGICDYFRVLFFGDFKEKKQKEFLIDEIPEDMICFLNALGPHYPYIRKISDDSIEILMRLADKFQCDLLKECLKEYIQVNGPNSTFSTAINWLISSSQYNMPAELTNICAQVLKIEDDSIELLMSLADEYQCDLLKERLKNYIASNKSSVSPTVINWLFWSKQYNMPEQIVNICVNILKIDDDSIEKLMRFLDEYECDALEKHLKNYIKNSGSFLHNLSGSTGFKWLVWSKQHNMSEEIVKVCLDIQKICFDTFESLMQWAEEHQCDVLKERLKRYIKENREGKDPSTSLTWLICSLKCNMPEELIKLLLPGVACLPLSTLCDNEEKIGSDLLAKLLDVKQRCGHKRVFLYLTSYDQKREALSCSHCGHSLLCGSRHGRFIKIVFCECHETHTFCSTCIHKNHDRNLPECCDMQDFYYKCSRCQSESLNEEQCICARENYEIMFKQMN